MPNVIFSMSVSADGYINEPDGTFDWTPPDEEVFLHHIEQVGALGAYVLGRRLYEAMLFWEQASDDALHELGERLQIGTEHLREFASIWSALPKVVFSRTLDAVEGSNTTLAQGDLSTELAAVLDRVDADIEIGGAELAAQAARQGLIDEYRLLVHPVAVGGGTPYFPRDHHLDLELVETRTFSSKVVFLRYRAVT